MSLRSEDSTAKEASKKGSPSILDPAQSPPIRKNAGLNRTRLAYLLMLGSSLAFAAMGAFAHATNERCDWRFPALVRAALVLVFSLVVARLRGTRLVVLGPATLWMRSFVGSLGIL